MDDGCGFHDPFRWFHGRGHAVLEFHASHRFVPAHRLLKLILRKGSDALDLPADLVEAQSQLHGRPSLRPSAEDDRLTDLATRRRPAITIPHHELERGGPDPLDQSLHPSPHCTRLLTDDSSEVRRGQPTVEDRSQQRPVGAVEVIGVVQQPLGTGSASLDLGLRPRYGLCSHGMRSGRKLRQSLVWLFAIL